MTWIRRHGVTWSLTIIVCKNNPKINLQVFPVSCFFQGMFFQPSSSGFWGEEHGLRLRFPPKLWQHFPTRNPWELPSAFASYCKWSIPKWMALYDPYIVVGWDTPSTKPILMVVWNIFKSWFIPISGTNPIWQIFFRWVESINQTHVLKPTSCRNLCEVSALFACWVPGARRRFGHLGQQGREMASSVFQQLGRPMNCILKTYNIYIVND